MKKFIFIAFFLSSSFFSKSVIAESDLNHSISFHFEQIETKKAINHLASIAEKNIILSDSIRDTITIEAKDLSWQEAFDLILRIKNLSSAQYGSVIYVAPYEEITKQQKQTLQFEEQQAQYSPLESRLIPVKYSKATELAKLLKEKNTSLLSKRGNISVDTRTNTIWIEDNPKKLNEITRFITQLDTPIKQVIIEARIISVNDHYEQELGIYFNQTLTTQNNRSNTGISFARLGSSAQLDVELSAMEDKQLGEIIAKPKLITADQHTAFIQSGEEIPYQQTGKRGATHVSFKKAVLGLEVTPQITPDNHILLWLKINQNKRGQLINGNPSIDTQLIETQVLAKNGDTIVLGGIYEHSKIKDRHALPFLGDLPILGDLLSKHYNANQRKELIIFITPKILPPEINDTTLEIG